MEAPAVPDTPGHELIGMGERPPCSATARMQRRCPARGAGSSDVDGSCDPRFDPTIKLASLHQYPSLAVREERPLLPPIARQAEPDTGRSWRSGRTPGTGRPSCATTWTASPSCSAAAAVSGSSAHDQHPRPGTYPRAGSHRTTNIIVSYGLTSAPGPARVFICGYLRPLPARGVHRLQTIPVCMSIHGGPAVATHRSAAFGAELSQYGWSR